MPTILIAIIAFALFFLLFTRFFPGKQLEETSMQGGEEPCFDEDMVTVVEDPPHGESARYIRCRISVTNQRIVISQLPLLSKKYSILIILYFADQQHPEKTGLEGRIKTGLLRRDAVEVKSDKSGDYLLLRPVGFGLFNREETELQVRSGRVEELSTAIRNGEPE
ncbi:MAG: hypothetical protein AB7H80_10425 [Candidatus Kapaibacterium sp.]